MFFLFFIHSNPDIKEVLGIISQILFKSLTKFMLIFYFKIPSGMYLRNSLQLDY